jgi:OOP family OmpA-OmpF porin
MAGLLSACSGAWDVEGLQSSKITGSAFDQALRDEYVRLATYERVQDDWADTAAYVTRGKLAAAGTPPAPEAIADRDLPADKVAELTAARATLMRYLTPAYKSSQPKNLALAQGGYECWMEQQEENWQLDDIAACKTQFQDAIKAMAEPAKPQPTAAMPGTSYVVYFGFNSAKLEGDALQVIREAAQTFKSEKAERADLAGHADRSGGQAFNDRLSSLRAEAVGEALMKQGIPESAITISAFGESDLAVATPDGAKEPRNRRVTIRLIK